MADYRERRIDAPAQEWLEEKGAAEFLGLSREAFRALVKDNVVPRGIEVNRENVHWHWRTIVAVSELMPFLLSKRDPSEK